MLGDAEGMVLHTGAAANITQNKNLCRHASRGAGAVFAGGVAEGDGEEEECADKHGGQQGHRVPAKPLHDECLRRWLWRC